MYEPETLKIFNAEYVKKDPIEAEGTTLTGEESVAMRMIG